VQNNLHRTRPFLQRGGKRINFGRVISTERGEGGPRQKGKKKRNLPQRDPREICKREVESFRSFSGRNTVKRRSLSRGREKELGPTGGIQ